MPFGNKTQETTPSKQSPVILHQRRDGRLDRTKSLPAAMLLANLDFLLISSIIIYNKGNKFTFTTSID